MLKANFKDKNWQGVVVQRGQLVTSRDHLALETGLSVKQIRLALDKLKSTGEISIKTTNKFTLVTIENYTLYQDIEDEEGQQRANKGPQLKKEKNLTMIRIKT